MNLVFIHGAGFTGACFTGQLTAFPQGLAPDLPGRGTPGAPDRIEQFADWLDGWIQERGLSQVVVAGHSMGGAVGLELALRRHPAVRALVLLDSGARLRVAPAIFERMESDFAEGARYIADFFFAEPAPERIAWAVDSMQRVGQAQTLRDFHACDAFDALDRLSEIGLPLLALTGEHDKMTPPKFAQAFSGRVPGAQTRILPGAGHFAMVERPAETNAAIAAFLRSIS